MSSEVHDFTLTTLSPVHIGSGKNYSCAEFIPSKAKSKDKIVKTIKRINLTEYYGSLDDDKRDKLLSYLVDSKFELKQFDSKIKKEFVRYQSIDNSLTENIKEIVEHIKTLDQLYIPGSSIKGAIRTAIFYDLISEEDIERIGNKITGNRKKNNSLSNEILNEYFAAFHGNSAQKNIFRFMQIADSTSLKVPKIEQALTIMATNDYRRNQPYSRNGNIIKTYLETIPEGKKLSSRIVTNFDKNLYKDLGINDKSKILDLDYIKESIFNFSADIIDYELDFADNYDINYLTEFYKCIKKHNSIDNPVMRIGSGSGLMGTSIALKIKEYDPSSFSKVQKTFKRQYDFEFPKSRKITKKGKPFGWVKLNFD